MRVRIGSDDDATANLIPLLQSRALYSKQQVPCFSPYRDETQAEILVARSIRLRLPCPVCDREDQTFDLVVPEKEQDASYLTYSIGRAFQLDFQCAHCRSDQSLTSFLLRADAHDRESAVVTKVGQYPSPRPPMDKVLRKALGDHSDWLKKGLDCESQGYGVGAFAYYRRVAEAIIGDLLDQIREVAVEEKKDDLAVAIDGLKAGGTGRDKIDAVKSLLPPWLAPEGTNPLATIYAALSDGLHNDSDEECTIAAEELRVTLTFVAGALHQHKGQRRDYLAALRGVQKKNEKKVAAKEGDSE